MNKIIVDKQEDRELLAVILVKNGYTVKFTKEKVQGANKFTYYVEYTK